MSVYRFRYQNGTVPAARLAADAYNFAHPGSAAFIAGVMSKVPAYAIIRFFFYIFGVNNPIISTALTVLGILGIGGVLIGSIMALAQYDFRRMLAYSSVAQIGYIAIVWRSAICMVLSAPYCISSTTLL